MIAMGKGVRVRVNVFPGGFNWPLFVGRQKDFFARHDLDVEVQARFWVRTKATSQQRAGPGQPKIRMSLCRMFALISKRYGGFTIRRMWMKHAIYCWRTFRVFPRHSHAHATRGCSIPRLAFFQTQASGPMESAPSSICAPGTAHPVVRSGIRANMLTRPIGRRRAQVNPLRGKRLDV